MLGLKSPEIFNVTMLTLPLMCLTNSKFNYILLTLFEFERFSRIKTLSNFRWYHCYIAKKNTQKSATNFQDIFFALTYDKILPTQKCIKIIHLLLTEFELRA